VLPQLWSNRNRSRNHQRVNFTRTLAAKYPPLASEMLKTHSVSRVATKRQSHDSPVISVTIVTKRNLH
jgi:hypothetical protein